MIQLSDLMPETWIGGRDGGLDYCDEWHPHNSWTFERVLMRPAVSVNQGNYVAPSVKLKVRIAGKARGTGCRAVSWTAEVVYGQWRYRIDRFRGKCTSCKDAQRQVMEHPDLCRVITQTLRRAYSPLEAECIYRKVDGQWEAWMTMLSVDWDQACWLWPVGKYEARSYARHYGAQPGEVRASTRERSYFGVSWGGHDGTEPKLECWLPEIPAAI